MRSLIRALGNSMKHELGGNAEVGSASRGPSSDGTSGIALSPPVSNAPLQSALLRNVLDVLPIGVWIVDAAGAVIYGNLAGQEIWGGARYVGINGYDEYKGWWPATGQRIAPQEWGAARAVARGEISLDEELDIECFDGSRKTILHSAVPIAGVGSEVLGAVVVIQNITERKAVRAALEQREMELEEAHRIGVAASWALRQTGALNWSAQAYRIFGLDEGNFTPSLENVLEVIHPEDRVGVRGWVDACRDGQAPGETEFRIVRPDGAIRILAGRGGLIPAQRGQPPYLAGTIQDITDRKRADAERERLLAALDQAGEAVFITRPDGTIEYVNAAFELVTGYARHEAIGKNPRFLSSGKQDAKFYEEFWGTIMAGSLWRGRMTNRRKDGTHFVQEATISPTLDAGGRVVSFVAVARDITEQLQMAERLVVSQKMEAIGTLAGGVAHDFNNLLSVILGYSRFIAVRLGATDPLRNDAEEITNAGERAAALTRQLLAFSRKQVLEPRLQDCNQVIERLVTMLRRLIGENIEFRLQLDARNATVLVDPGQLEQAITNLVVNARDAMATGGSLEIATSEICIDQKQHDEDPSVAIGEYVRIAVADTGCGMDEEVLLRLFDPFFTTKPKDKGTGLGLSTVYGIMKQSGGSVTVESRLGEGSKICLLLPRKRGSVTYCAPHRSEGPRARGSETILVVEDEEAVRRSIVRQLRSVGYHVINAPNGIEGLAVSESHQGQLHLLLTDMVMPQMGGLQLAHRIKAKRPELRVLFMSGYPDEGFAQRNGSAVRPPTIGKPFAENELEAKVREVLDSPESELLNRTGRLG